MKSAGWCAYMQSQLEREERQKEYERKRAEQKRGRWSIYLPKNVHCAEAQCISVKENMVNSLAVAIIPIAKAQEK